MQPATAAHAFEYEVPTDDGRAKILVTVDSKFRTVDRSRPFILMVGGTASDADGAIFVEGKRKYIWAELGTELAKLGFNAVRFGERGIVPSSKCPQTTKNLAERRFTRCVDDTQRAVLPVGYVGKDIATVYRDLQQRFSIREERISVLGHSEGGTQIARLISRQQLNPASAISLATPLQPLRDLLEYRSGRQRLQAFLRMDSNGDGLVTEEEVIANYSTDDNIFFGSRDGLLSVKSGWTNSNRAALLKFFQKDFERERNFVAVRGKGASIEGTLDGRAFNVGLAEDLLEKFNDPIALGEYLAGYKGRTLAVLFSDDLLVPLSEQNSYIKAFTKRGAYSKVLVVDGVRHDFTLTSDRASSAWQKMFAAIFEVAQPRAEKK